MRKSFASSEPYSRSAWGSLSAFALAFAHEAATNNRLRTVRLQGTGRGNEVALDDNCSTSDLDFLFSSRSALIDEVQSFTQVIVTSEGVLALGFNLELSVGAAHALECLVVPEKA